MAPPTLQVTADGLRLFAQHCEALAAQVARMQDTAATLTESTAEYESMDDGGAAALASVGGGASAGSFPSGDGGAGGAGNAGGLSFTRIAAGVDGGAGAFGASR